MGETQDEDGVVSLQAAQWWGYVMVGAWDYTFHVRIHIMYIYVYVYIHTYIRVTPKR